MERRYSVPPPTNGSPGMDGSSQQQVGAMGSMGAVGGRLPPPLGPSASEDLHAWSIYRQNLNSDFTDSALGSSEKSPLPYGNFQLRESTVQSILSHPRYGPRSALGANMYTYLKFGLPRVFPPSRLPRDGSSGYDSSDDASPHLQRHGRNYLRSRSDPDFRNHTLHRPYSGHGPRPAPPPGGGRSSSEANLLSQEAHMRHQQHHRRSMHDLRTTDHHSQLTGHRRVSKAGSQVSLARSRRGPHRDDMSALGGRQGPVAKGAVPYYAILDSADMAGIFKYPHLQVRGLEVESRSCKRLLLAGISFEAHGGDIMAVMATSEDEGTALLDALSGRSSNIGKVRGDVLLNGQSVRCHQLRGRVAYVQNDSHLSRDLTVRQTLAFHSWLRRSSTPVAKLDAKNRMDALVEDLGLDQVRHTKVAGLTTSERRRLNVACHLLLDTDVVVLDQPTRGMDIFDTFFLVEFLRQWAGGAGAGAAGGVHGGRIVILTLHPPTYEIFTMLSRVALVSAGRLMFGGRRRHMLPYFAMVDYPCPAYKNPSDYYLDLVTLDDLSAEAMLESSQRIEQLAEVFLREQEPLSDPGRPVPLPGRICQANYFTQAFVLFLRALVYTQPLTLVRWLTLVLLAASLSLVVGLVFWDVAVTDPYQLFNDRMGFHYSMTFVAPWPILLLLTLAEVKRERWGVHRDINDHLYGRFLYIVTKVAYNLPASLLVWLAFLVPAYLMSGLHIQGSNHNGFSVYVGHMLLYLTAMQMMVTAIGHLVRSQYLAGVVAGVIFTALALVSGLPVHSDDLGVWCRWLGLVSPPRWILPLLLQREHRQEAISTSTGTVMCHKKQVQHQDIIVQLPCPPANGTAVLDSVGLLPDPRQPHYMPALATLVFWFLCLLLAAGGFLACRPRPRQPRNNPNKP